MIYLLRCAVAFCGAASLLAITGCGSTDSTTGNSLIVTPSTSNALAVTVGGAQTYSVTFNSSDQHALRSLLVGGLNNLPTGWSGPESFTCAMVTTGSGCVLNLTYTPTASDASTLIVHFTYFNDRGELKSVSQSVPYSATVSDNIAAVASPSGQVVAVVGASAQAVTINFATDDGNTATALTLDLAALPAGWSGTDTVFTCQTVSTGNGCQLSLAYAPIAVGSGMLSVAYTYRDNSGTSKNGTLNIPYAATTHNNAVAAVSPSGQITAMAGSGSQPVTVTFTTDDTNTATGLTVTTTLASLPTGWSSNAGSFNCASVSTGTSCQLPLTYAPFAAGSGTLTVNYSYTDNSGAAKTGGVNIGYTAVAPPHLYVTDFFADTVSYCPTNADGTLGSCASTGSGFARPTSITFFASRAYITNDANNTISVCTVAANGALNSCVTAASLNEPQYVAINPTGTFAYVWDNFGVNMCAVSATDGTLSACTQTGIVSGSGNSIRFPVISADGARIYGTWLAGGGYDSNGDPINAISLCPIQPDGTIPTCTATGSQADNANLTFAITASALYASAQGGGIIACPVNTNGSLGSCQSTAAGLGSVSGLAVGSSYAYVVGFDPTVNACPVMAGGLLGVCTTLTPGGFGNLNAVALH